MRFMSIIIYTTVLLRRIITTLLLVVSLFWSTYVLAPLQGNAQGFPPVKNFPHPERIRYDGDCMTIENKDVFIYSAAFHYFRTPKELWRDRFRKIKAAGFNTVETYIPWNWHERVAPASITDQSKFDFSDLSAWLKMAHEEFGFYTIVRPGPFICAEWSGGAYPRWLAMYGPGKGDFWLRSADPEHIKWCIHWFDAVCKFVAKDQLTRKPKGSKGIIMLQIENEYDADGSKDKAVFLKALYRSVKRNGIDVPVFTCLTSQCRGSKDPELSQVFDCDNYYTDQSGAAGCAHRMVSLRKRQTDAPGFVTEMQGGWFSTVTGRLSEEHFSDARHFNAISLMTLLGGGTGINYYMFVGGTHFAGWGARGMTTTYDYNAAIGESGICSPKYYAATSIGNFIHRYEQPLLRSKGGPCNIQGVPKNITGGIRIAPDGTKFIFLNNSDAKASYNGQADIVPGSIAKATEPIYNIDQNGQHVQMKTADGNPAADSLKLDNISIACHLEPLGAKVLVIPPGAAPQNGVWYPEALSTTASQLPSPATIRIDVARKTDDPLAMARWKALPEGASLTQLGVNDFRYSLYRSKVKLDDQQVKNERYLLFNMFTRDIVSVSVNGTPAKRLFPEKADAQTWLTRGCYDRIKPDEYDNRFDVSGLLKSGNNEINVVYEDLGHAHGYVPMEELAGIRKAGLSLTDTTLTHPLKWEYAADAAGISLGYQLPAHVPAGWKIVLLDAVTEISRKGNFIQPREPMNGLFTWYRVEFSLPADKAALESSWLARISASGNGYMWLNGHNIGRHWEAGPQREFYLPECWLNFGTARKNVLVMGLRQTESGAFLKAMEIRPYAANK